VKAWAVCPAKPPLKICCGGFAAKPVPVISRRKLLSNHIFKRILTESLNDAKQYLVYLNIKKTFFSIRRLVVEEYPRKAQTKKAV